MELNRQTEEAFDVSEEFKPLSDADLLERRYENYGIEFELRAKKKKAKNILEESVGLWEAEKAYPNYESMVQQISGLDDRYNKLKREANLIAAKNFVNTEENPFRIETFNASFNSSKALGRSDDNAYLAAHNDVIIGEFSPGVGDLYAIEDARNSWKRGDSWGDFGLYASLAAIGLVPYIGDGYRWIRHLKDKYRGPTWSGALADIEETTDTTTVTVFGKPVEVNIDSGPLPYMEETAETIIRREGEPVHINRKDATTLENTIASIGRGGIETYSPTVEALYNYPDYANISQKRLISPEELYNHLKNIPEDNTAILNSIDADALFGKKSAEYFEGEEISIESFNEAIQNAKLTPEGKYRIEFPFVTSNSRGVLESSFKRIEVDDIGQYVKLLNDNYFKFINNELQSSAAFSQTANFIVDVIRQDDKGGMGGQGIETSGEGISSAALREPEDAQEIILPNVQLQKNQGLIIKGGKGEQVQIVLRHPALLRSLVERGTVNPNVIKDFEETVRKLTQGGAVRFIGVAPENLMNLNARHLVNANLVALEIRSLRKSISSDVLEILTLRGAFTKEFREVLEEFSFVPKSKETKHHSSEAIEYELDSLLSENILDSYHRAIKNGEEFFELSIPKLSTSPNIPISASVKKGEDLYNERKDLFLAYELRKKLDQDDIVNKSYAMLGESLPASLKNDYVTTKISVEDFERAILDFPEGFRPNENIKEGLNYLKFLPPTSIKEVGNYMFFLKNREDKLLEFETLSKTIGGNADVDWADALRGPVNTHGFGVDEIGHLRYTINGKDAIIEEIQMDALQTKLRSLIQKSTKELSEVPFTYKKVSSSLLKFLEENGLEKTNEAIKKGDFKKVSKYSRIVSTDKLRENINASELGITSDTVSLVETGDALSPNKVVETPDVANIERYKNFTDNEKEFGGETYLIQTELSPTRISKDARTEARAAVGIDKSLALNTIEEGVEKLLINLILDAKKSGVNRIVLPSIEKLMNARGRTTGKTFIHVGEQSRKNLVNEKEDLLSIIQIMLDGDAGSDYVRILKKGGAEKYREIYEKAFDKAVEKLVIKSDGSIKALNTYSNGQPITVNYRANQHYGMDETTAINYRTDLMNATDARSQFYLQLHLKKSIENLSYIEQDEYLNILKKVNNKRIKNIEKPLLDDNNLNELAEEFLQKGYGHAADGTVIRYPSEYYAQTRVRQSTKKYLGDVIANKILEQVGMKPKEFLENLLERKILNEDMVNYIKSDGEIDIRKLAEVYEDVQVDEFRKLRADLSELKPYSIDKQPVKVLDISRILENVELENVKVGMAKGGLVDAR